MSQANTKDTAQADKKDTAQAGVKDQVNKKEMVQALKNSMEMIDKNFGKGSIMRLGDKTDMKIEVIKTGSLGLDLALGVGGYPKGRIVEIFGPESSGKTTLALHAVAEAQKAGGVVAYIDAEHALDPEYAANLGVDIENLLISQPDTGEQALEIADILTRSGTIALLVIDSVAALVPKVEIEGEMGDQYIGLHARLMSQALRKITGGLNNSNTTAIFINQLREKVGVMFGSPEVTTGGRALKFYSTVRLDIRKQDVIREGDNAIGNRTKVKVVKNKVASPFKSAEFEIIFAKGISKESEILQIASDKGVIQKSGSWYNYGKTQLGQGRDAARDFLVENPKILQEVIDKFEKFDETSNGAVHTPQTPGV
jgi:recombination protein RecA